MDIQNLVVVSKRKRIITALKNNTYDLSGEYGIGYTSKGEEFYFDLEDYDLIKDYCWRTDRNGYIVSNEPNINRSIISMHRLVFSNIEQLNKKQQVDHKNHKKSPPQ